MDRMKTKEDVGGDTSQWVWNPNKAWSWIQDWIDLNFRKFLNKFFTTSGVFFYGVQTALKCTGAVKSSTEIQLTIEAGAGINSNGDMIILPSQVVDATISWPSDDTYYLWLEHKLSDDTDTTYEVNRIPESYPDIQTHMMDDYDIKLETAWPTGAQLDKSIKIASIVVTDPTAVVTDAREQAVIFGISAAAWTWINDNYASLTKDGTTESVFTVNGQPVLHTGSWPAPRLPLLLVLTTGVTGFDFGGRRLIAVGWESDDGQDLVPSSAWIRARWGLEGSGTWTAQDVFNPGITMAVGVWDKDGTDYYYLWYEPDQAFYKIESNTATLITVTSGQGAPSSGSGDFTVGPGAHTYEIQVTSKTLDGSIITGMIRTHRIEYAQEPTAQEFIKDNLSPGVMTAMRVRALHGPFPGVGSPSGWTAWQEVKAGYGLLLVMTPITVDSVDSGVRVSWAPVENVAGYRAVYTLNGPKPDRMIQAHRKTDSTKSTRINISASPGDIVKVGVYCFDQLARMSKNTEFNDSVNGNTAGGVVLGEYQHQITLNNKEIVGATTVGKGLNPGQGRFLAMQRVSHIMSIKELAIVVETFTLNGTGNRGVIRMFGRGGDGDAAIITFDSTGPVELPLNFLVDPGYLIFDAYDPANTGSGNQTEFRVDIYVGYRYGEVRPTDEPIVVDVKTRLRQDI